MKHFIHPILRSMAMLALLLAATQNLSAQSTVYFFMRAVNGHEGTTCTITQDDDKTFNILGSVDKVRYENLIFYKPSVRKCRYNQEGQKTFELNYHWVGGTVLNLEAEITLDLKAGSTHYVYITYKSASTFKMEEIDEKKAEKLFKEKNLDTLPELVDGEPAEASAE